MSTLPMLPDDYRSVLEELKHQIRGARMQAQHRVNTELIQLYWRIGRAIDARQTSGTWGTGVLNRIADDLRAEFPEMKGFSRSDLKYRRAFARSWPGSDPIGQQAVGQLPWGHITVLLFTIQPATTTERRVFLRVEVWRTANAAASRSRNTHRGDAPHTGGPSAGRVTGRADRTAHRRPRS